MHALSPDEPDVVRLEVTAVDEARARAAGAAMDCAMWESTGPSDPYRVPGEDGVRVRLYAHLGRPAAPAPSTTVEDAADLVAICAICLTAVADGEGVLEVDTDAALRAMEASRKRMGTSATLPDGSRARQVRWQVRHHACGRRPRCRCDIAVERVRSWPALVHWTSHLQSKSWLVATDWSELLARAVEPRRGAVSGILPAQPRPLSAGPIGDRPGG